MSDPTIAAGEIGATPIAGGGVRNPPTVAITAPTGTIILEDVTATWTYTSAVSRPQLSFQVRVETTNGDTIFDSGSVAGAAVSYLIPFSFTSGQYVVVVSASDGLDSGTSSGTFTFEVPTVEDIADEPRVGSVFEIGINGVGYMLSDTPQRPYRRQVGSLQAPRFADGSTPFSEAIDRYTFIGQVDWSGGEGQRFANRPRSDDTRFFLSEGVDVFGLDGGVSLLNDTTRHGDGTEPVDGPSVVVGDEVFSISGGEVVSQSGAAIPAVTVQPAGTTVEDLTTDGVTLFALTDTGLRSCVPSGGALSWTSLNAAYGTSHISLDWCVDRLVVCYVDAGGDGVVSTLDSAGAEEVASGRFQFPGLTPTSPVGGDGYLWFGIGGDVYAWNVGSTDSRFQALSLPSGQTVQELFFYLGNVMIYAVSGSASAPTVSVYRATSSAGQLIPELVAEFVTTVAPGTGLFTAASRLVMFAWPGMLRDGSNGVGAIDLSTGGYARWFSDGSAGAAAVGGLYNRDGVVGFVADASDFFEQDADVFVTSGLMELSASDLGSSLLKVIDEWSVVHGPLPNATGVELEVSTNEGLAWSAVATNDQAGSLSTRGQVELESSVVQVRFTLTSDGTASPTVRNSAVKVHPLTITDDVVELPVNCGNELVGLNGVMIEPQVSATERMRQLERLAGSRVRLQDVDWPVTRTAEVWEVVSVDSTSTGVFDRSSDRRTESSAVSVVTMRRAS